MRLSPLLVLVAFVPACGYSYHPEYHPVTSVNYAQTVGGSTPAVITSPAPAQNPQAPQQQIVVAPAGGPTAQFPAPPPPPTPPENFPW